MVISQPEHLYLAAASLIAGTGAVFDLRSRRIPNLLTGPAIVIALAAHSVVHGWSGLISSAEAGLICGLVFFLFFLAGGMGAGDVKLIAAVGSMMGVSVVAPLLILTALAGGLLALGLALTRGRLLETVSNMCALVRHHGSHGLRPHPRLNLENAQTLRLPYGLAIAAGSVLTFVLAVERGAAR